MKINKYNLSRSIPTDVKRKVRELSKFGCVMCRCGIYQYEHIEPEFVESQEHNPFKICCLCGRCHDKVTRKQLSKSAVLKAYEHIQSSTNIDKPSEFFDFYSGKSKLSFGGLTSNISPNIVFKCYGKTIFSVVPGKNESQGSINARFYNDEGKPVFKIIGNEWIGENSGFDLEIIGKVFTIRSPNNRISLKLRHEAPGEVVIERMDMRFEDIHLLVSEHDIAIGRYNGFGRNLIWMHAKVRIDNKSLHGSAINILKPNKKFLKESSKLISAKNAGIIFNQFKEKEKALITDQNLPNIIDTSLAGINWPAIGFRVAENSIIAFSACMIGVCSISHARKFFYKKNRVNQPTLYLPQILNKKTINEEIDKVDKNVIPIHLPESFLVKEDICAIRQWEERNIKLKHQAMSNIFFDDQPALISAYGSFKLLDSYNGPSNQAKT